MNLEGDDELNGHVTSLAHRRCCPPVPAMGPPLKDNPNQEKKD